MYADKKKTKKVSKQKKAHVCWLRLVIKCRCKMINNKKRKKKPPGRVDLLTSALPPYWTIGPGGGRARARGGGEHPVVSIGDIVGKPCISIEPHLAAVATTISKSNEDHTVMSLTS